MNNMRSAVLMVLAMLGFAIEDMFIKQLAGTLPIGQIIGTFGAGGSVVFALLCKLQGDPLFTPAMREPSVLLRNAGELIGTLGFMTAITLIPLSTASAILQATPLIVTLGAALFFGETVGWRRWSAIFVGLLGVLLIIRPGMNDFDWLSLLALQGVLGLALRDLATRRVKVQTSSTQLSFLAFLTLVPVSVILTWATDRPFVAIDGHQALVMFCAILIGALAYLGIVLAMRVGEISFVTPFRYSRLVFALIIGVVVFSERPDTLTLIGAAVIVVSGIYTVWREHRLKTAQNATSLR